MGVPWRKLNPRFITHTGGSLYYYSEEICVKGVSLRQLNAVIAPSLESRLVAIHEPLEAMVFVWIFFHGSGANGSYEGVHALVS